MSLTRTSGLLASLGLSRLGYLARSRVVLTDESQGRAPSSATISGERKWSRREGCENPELREARAAARLDIAGREALHGRASRAGRCAIEAAETSQRLAATGDVPWPGCSWLVTVATAVLPNWTTYMGRSMSPRSCGLSLPCLRCCTGSCWCARCEGATLPTRGAGRSCSGPSLRPWPVASLGRATAALT